MRMIVSICYARHSCLAVKRSVLPSLQWQLAQQRLPAFHNARFMSKGSMKFPDEPAAKTALEEKVEKGEPVDDRPLPWLSSDASALSAGKMLASPRRHRQDRFMGSPQFNIIFGSLFVWVLYYITLHDEQEKSEIINAALYPVLGGPNYELDDLVRKMKIRRLFRKDTLLEEYRMAEIIETQNARKTVGESLTRGRR